MTVGELKEFLKTLSEDLEVIIEDSSYPSESLEIENIIVTDSEMRIY